MLQYIANEISSLITMGTTWLNTVTSGNQFLAGSLLLVLSGTVFWFKKIPGRLWNLFWYRITTGRTLSSINKYDSSRAVLPLDSFVVWFNNSRWFKLAKYLDSYHTSNQIKGDSGNLFIPLSGTYPFICNGSFFWARFYVSEEKTLNGLTKNF